MTVIGPAQQANMGPANSRIDGRAKVTGTAAYASDFPLGRPAYAFFVTSAIARGRIESFDLAAAKDVPGLREFLSTTFMQTRVS